MTKAKVLLIVAFAVTFAAGAAVGLLVPDPGHRPRGPSWLTAELGLTDQQREQMHEIWSEAMRAGRSGHWEQRKALAEHRDQAIAALLTETQRPQYDSILQDYAAKMDELHQEGKQAFEQAVERTKQILTPDQARKYDELLQERAKRGPGDRRGPPWGGRPTRPEGDDQPTDDPSTPRRGG
ncbi:MAG TPA: periplasmic heavy metal sensor [Phycisphaerae bacterium]|nr:periplasmic heavy metal sensor [Phycisphaerae bacterium]